MGHRVPKPDMVRGISELGRNLVDSQMLYGTQGWSDPGNFARFLYRILESTRFCPNSLFPRTMSVLYQKSVLHFKATVYESLKICKVNSYRAFL